MGCWTQVGPGGPGRRGERRFSRSTNADRWAEEQRMSHSVTWPSDWHPPLQVLTTTMCYCYQVIHSGGQNRRAQKLPPFTSYVQHHDSGKNRHSIISTKPPPQQNRGPIIHMPYMSTTVQTSSAHCTYICIPLSVYTSTHEQLVSHTAVPRGAQAGQGAKRASGAL